MDTLTQQALIVKVEEPSQVAEARRRAAAMGRAVTLDAESLSRLEMVTTELGTNMLRHGKGGSIVITSPRTGSVEVIALDRGPGISDLERSLEDGYSTGSTPGLGLGVIRRQSQGTSIFAPANMGAVMSALVQSPKLHDVPDVAVVCVPLQGEDVCGDTWARGEVEDRQLFLIADGLGHGSHAAEASQLAARIFRGALSKSPDEIVRQMHLPMRATRGAAVMIVSLDRGKRLLRWCGVGNISGSLQRAESSRGLSSDNGTVGHQMSRARLQEAPWSPVDTLIMHSDGLSGRWRMDGYPGLLSRSLATIAGVLYRDHSRERDDRTVLVAKLA